MKYLNSLLALVLISCSTTSTAPNGTVTTSTPDDKAILALSQAIAPIVAKGIDAAVLKSVAPAQ